MNIPTLDNVQEAMVRKGYAWFCRPDSINLVGIRHPDPLSNGFNDWMTCTWCDEWGHWTFRKWRCTTDPGRYYRENPLNVRGSAIVVPGQYRGAYTLGLHKGYEAIVQAKPISVWRDNDKDEILDWEGNTHSGVYGINIHRANANSTSQNVDRWSAGCQVLANPHDYAELLAIVKRSCSHFGTHFTYTLLEGSDL